MRVTSIRRETAATRAVRLAVDGRSFAFRAGQAAAIGIASGAERVPYSIATAPEETDLTGELEFLVKLEDDGSWGPHLEGLAPGADVDVRGPLGGFFFPDEPEGERFLFVAGGTGIAPIRAMIRHVQLTGLPARLQLLYSARTPRDFPYLRELRGMARRRELDLALTVTRGRAASWRGDAGRITATVLRNLVGDDHPLAFLCGPSSMVVSVAQMLREIGVEEARIRMERWDRVAQ